MAREFPYDLLEDPAALAEFEGWAESVYRDLLAVQKGHLQVYEFEAKYASTRAILVLDLTGFTLSAQSGGAIHSFLRILDAQKVCIPALRKFRADLIRTFADDVVALFTDASDALRAAFEIRERIHTFNRSGLAGADAPECCIGIGYGNVYAIGPNRAMGDEMNQASKLGEDTARGGEILVTEGFRAAIGDDFAATFEPQAADDLVFPFYRVTPKS